MCAGSVERGYVFWAILSSRSQVKVNESWAIVTVLVCSRIPFLSAYLNVWAVVFWETPTFTVNVVALVTVTVNHLLLYGSVDLGYECWVAWLSSAQVNVTDASLIIILSPLESPWLARVTTVNTPVLGLYAVPVVAVWAVGGVKPWEDLVSTKSPVTGLYVAPVGWKALPVLGLTAVPVADTNVCLYWAPNVMGLFRIISTANLAACFIAKIDSCSSPWTWSSVT